MLKAIFPGSFDPPTFGHLNIIERARGVFEKLVVVVAENREKKRLFSPEERIVMLKELTKSWGNVTVVLWDSLIVDYMKLHDIRIMVRGIRGMNDFAYEFELSMMNKALDPRIETIFMTTDPEYFVLRSSAIRELASFHGDVSAMVPPLIAEALKEKYK